VVTRLKEIAGPAHARTLSLSVEAPASFAEPPPKVIDDWSWRAALQAESTDEHPRPRSPLILGMQVEILRFRHLEQRMDCLAQALRIAPKATLQEILNVYRRCEEELESHVKQEAEQRRSMGCSGDEQVMPGGYAPNAGEEDNKLSCSGGKLQCPLFDLSRASMARAQNGF